MDTDEEEYVATGDKTEKVPGAALAKSLEQSVALLRQNLGSPLEYEVVHSTLVRIRAEPSTLSAAVGKLKHKSVVLGFPAGKWLFIEHAEAKRHCGRDRRLAAVPDKGAWALIDPDGTHLGKGRLLAPKWGQMKLERLFNGPGAIASWPGIGEDGVEYIVQYRWKISQGGMDYDNWRAEQRENTYSSERLMQQRKHIWGADFDINQVHSMQFRVKAMVPPLAANPDSGVPASTKEASLMGAWNDGQVILEREGSDSVCSQFMVGEGVASLFRCVRCNRSQAAHLRRKDFGEAGDVNASYRLKVSKFTVEAETIDKSEDHLERPPMKGSTQKEDLTRAAEPEVEHAGGTEAEVENAESTEPEVEHAVDKAPAVKHTEFTKQKVEHMRSAQEAHFTPDNQGLPDDREWNFFQDQQRVEGSGGQGGKEHQVKDSGPLGGTAANVEKRPDGPIAPPPKPTQTNHANAAVPNRMRSATEPDLIEVTRREKLKIPARVPVYELDESDNSEGGEDDDQEEADSYQDEKSTGHAESSVLLGPQKSAANVLRKSEPPQANPQAQHNTSSAFSSDKAIPMKSPSQSNSNSVEEPVPMWKRLQAVSDRNRSLAAHAGRVATNDSDASREYAAPTQHTLTEVPGVPSEVKQPPTHWSAGATSTEVLGAEPSPEPPSGSLPLPARPCDPSGEGNSTRSALARQASTEAAAPPAEVSASGRPWSGIVIIPDAASLWQEEVLGECVSAMGGRLMRSADWPMDEFAGPWVWSAKGVEVLQWVKELGAYPSEGMQFTTADFKILQRLDPAGPMPVFVLVDMGYIAFAPSEYHDMSSRSRTATASGEQVLYLSTLTASATQAAAAAPRVGAPRRWPTVEASGLILAITELLEDAGFQQELDKRDARTGGALAAWIKNPPWQAQGIIDLAPCNLANVSSSLVVGWAKSLAAVVVSLADPVVPTLADPVITTKGQSSGSSDSNSWVRAAAAAAQPSTQVARSTSAKGDRPLGAASRRLAARRSGTAPVGEGAGAAITRGDSLCPQRARGTGVASGSAAHVTSGTSVDAASAAPGRARASSQMSQTSSNRANRAAGTPVAAGTPASPSTPAASPVASGALREQGAPQIPADPGVPRSPVTPRNLSASGVLGASGSPGLLGSPGLYRSQATPPNVRVPPQTADPNEAPRPAG
mmetsp:Transcript_53330/g.114591  ORF Transcript_53330/g.114591 Transcript_53330/m.114591 type:complete len:1170 (-) Transcript_53330:85-3594(-)